MKSERRSKNNKKKKPWSPRGNQLIPPNRVERLKKGKGSYDRRRKDKDIQDD